MTEESRSGENEVNQRSDIEIANELINFANHKQEAGTHPTIIAAAFRHAAANFTAFAYAHNTNESLATETITEEFLRTLEFYDKHHRGKAPPMTSLERLVEQVKGE